MSDNAFPVPRGFTDGLTKRELFAAMAMAPMIRELCGEPDTGCSEIAAACVQMADALLAELAKGAKE